MRVSCLGANLVIIGTFVGMMGSHQQKNNLVFHGMKPDKMEVRNEFSREYCYIK